MSRLIDFYRQDATDTEGRRLADIWAWDDEELEIVHDFVQWLFPIPEASDYNPDAPGLTEEDIAAFRSDARLRGNLLRSFERFLNFLGLRLDPDGRVVEGATFAQRVPEVWAHRNHNWLRLTRAIRSLVLLGLEREGHALFAWLEAASLSRKYPIGADTMRYWSRAVQGLVPSEPRS
jgi:hypothetical protein